MPRKTWPVCALGQSPPKAIQLLHTGMRGIRGIRGSVAVFWFMIALFFVVALFLTNIFINAKFCINSSVYHPVISSYNQRIISAQGFRGFQRSHPAVCRIGGNPCVILSPHPSVESFAELLQVGRSSAG